MTSSDANAMPRLKVINRQQMQLRAVDVEELIDPEHPARSIWEFVGRLNLDSFCCSLHTFEGYAVRSALHPISSSHFVASLYRIPCALVRQ